MACVTNVLLATSKAARKMEMYNIVFVFAVILSVSNLDFAQGKSIKVHLKGHEEFIVGAPPNTSDLEPPRKILAEGLRWIFGGDAGTGSNITAAMNQSDMKENPGESIKDGDDLNTSGSVLLDRIIRAVRSKRSRGRKKREDAWETPDGWESEWSKPGGAQDTIKVGLEEISDYDIRSAQFKEIKDILVYSGSVFGSTALFVTFAVLVFRYPESFICGCCFSFCCIKVCCPRLHLYLTNPEKYVHDRMNQYVPGMIIEDDGNVVHYTPTPEELELLTQIIEELMAP